MEDVNVKFVNMPTLVKEVVKENSDMSYTILLNARLSRETQLKAYAHALKHINDNDFENEDSVDQIEIDAHRCE